MIRGEDSVKTELVYQNNDNTSLLLSKDDDGWLLTYEEDMKIKILKNDKDLESESVEDSNVAPASGWSFSVQSQFGLKWIQDENITVILCRKRFHNFYIKKLNDGIYLLYQ